MQTKSRENALFRKGSETQGAKVYRTERGVRTDKIQHELQTFPAFEKG